MPSGSSLANILRYATMPLESNELGFAAKVLIPNLHRNGNFGSIHLNSHPMRLESLKCRLRHH